MLIYKPRELQRDGKPTGLWHMTVGSDEEKWGPHATGPCAHGCEGHATPEEAIAHYDEGEAAKARFTEDPDEQRRCRICQAWTTVRARTSWHVFPLCSEHQTKNNVRALLRIEREREEG